MKHFNSSLLFYASGGSFDAEYAKGNPRHSFLKDVQIKDGGAKDKCFECENRQLLAWRAPGNIYAERGTLSFFWRSRYPVGPTAFPIFRVGFSDHSSWDAVWLRIDWSGEGFEAFITDINLSRARVCYRVEENPRPDIWSHFALAWDENWGIKLYVNGEKVAEEYRPAVYFTGLDQFGPHSRIISHWQVQSDYNFIRGGDICEIAIHDSMLCCEDILALSEAKIPTDVDEYRLDLKDEDIRKNWQLRNGFDGHVPEVSDQASVRKVEIHDAYDLKRWWWKGCDGIRETTWPGVYNRSRLKGRNDYFQLPDWDCYSLSGKAITFHAPDEEYNHIEISGSAFGGVELVDDDGGAIKTLFERPKGIERSVNKVEQLKGGKIRFTNVLKEEPIGDFSLYNVTEGKAPKGVKKVSYSLMEGYSKKAEAQHELITFIKGRYLPYERNIMTAVAQGESADFTGHDSIGGYPFVNIVVPYEGDDSLGLDGVELKLPRLSSDVKIAVQIKDPLWYYRNLAHFVFSAKAGEEKTIWFDTRDRILPENKCLYITIAFSEGEYGVDFLKEATIGLIYKTAEDAKAEHVIDRFTQLRDIYGHMVEERPSVPELNCFNRVKADLFDLMKVDPDHKPGQYYFYDFAGRPMRGRPPLVPGYLPDYRTDQVPEGVPAWAFKQVEMLKHYKYIINYYIDERMLENGELGGGLSDDGDFVALWCYLVMMGSDPEKVYEAMVRNTDAFYDQGLFTNGLSSIQADELHSSEEGIVSVAACLMANNGDPKMFERAMENARQLGWVTGINCAGHRHVKSTYFSGSVMAREEPWGGSQPAVFSAFCPSWMVSRFNGNEKIRKYLRELADGILAHYDHENNRINSYIRFDDDKVVGTVFRNEGNRAMLFAATAQTGNESYAWMLPENHNIDERRTPGLAEHPFLPFDENGVLDKAKIAENYEVLCFHAGMGRYYNTLGSCWIDRVHLHQAMVACHRTGDPSGINTRALYANSRFGWRFENPGDDEKLGIIAPVSKGDSFKVVVCNISGDDVTARLIGDEVEPGLWSFKHGLDNDDDDMIDGGASEFAAEFERTTGVELTFPANATTVVEAKLKQRGVSYWDRCDLAIGKDDIKFYDHGMNVTVHSIGAVDSPEAEIVLKNADGKILKKAVLPSLEAPRDLWPRYRDVIFNLHNVESLEGCYVEIDPEGKLNEITRSNNIVKL